MRALAGLLWGLRWLLVVGAVVGGLSALFTTFDGVEVEIDSGPSTPPHKVECGSLIAPADPARLEPDAVDDCRDRVAHTRGTRLGALAVGLAASILLNLALFARIRTPQDLRRSFSRSSDLNAHSERLHLRPVVPDDLRGLLDTCDQEMLDANGWGPEQLAGYANAVGSPTGLGTSHVANHAIVRRDTGEVVGGASITPGSEALPVHIGWWIGPQHRRQGVGTEVARLVIDALHDTGHPLVNFGTSEDNVAVRRIAATLGAEQVKVSRHKLPNGTSVAAVWFQHARANSAGGRPGREEGPGR